MRFIVTGFEPFGGLAQNASWEAVRRLPGRPGNDVVYAGLLPVEYDRCARVLFSQIERLNPDAVLCVGVAVGRDVISLEQVAVNVKASESPDNAGVLCNGEKIYPGAPDSLNSNLRMKELAAMLQEEKIPAKLSFSAGSFVCNNLYYHLLHLVHTEAPALAAGFIHVPPCEADLAQLPADTPYLPTQTVTHALELVIGSISRGFAVH